MSKPIITIVLFLVLISAQHSIAQSKIIFSEKGLKAALEQGKAENKPVMLWCYASWCPHCQHMKETVFTNRAVSGYFNKTYICVLQDMEKGAGVEMKKNLGIHAYPTFVFYNPKGEIIYRVEGEQSPYAFIDEGKNALIQKNQLPYLKQQFEKDSSNSINCYEYVRALKKGGLDVSTVINQYFATQTDKQLLSEINWQIFTNGVSDINSRVFRFIIAHQKEYATIASAQRVKRKFDYEVKSLLEPLVETIDTINYPVKRALAAQIHSYSTDSLIFNYDLRISALAQNWKMYAATCLQSVKIYAWNNATQLNDIAGNFVLHITAPDALLQAVSWAKRSIALDKEYDTYLNCSKLYQKLNDTPNAVLMAEKAITLASKFGWEGKDAEQLLKELNSTKQ
jgi:thioredoxin-related protein